MMNNNKMINIIKKGKNNINLMNKKIINIIKILLIYFI